MYAAPVVNQKTLYGRFVVHCFFKIWLERSFQGAVNKEKRLGATFVYTGAVYIICGVHGGGVGGCPAGGLTNTYSSSKMGFYEDGTVKMAWSSSKTGVFEDGNCQQLGFGVDHCTTFLLCTTFFGGTNITILFIKQRIDGDSVIPRESHETDALKNGVGGMDWQAKRLEGKVFTARYIDSAGIHLEDTGIALIPVSMNMSL